jgi:hypothetical protein
MSQQYTYRNTQVNKHVYAARQGWKGKEGKGGREEGRKEGGRRRGGRG